MANKIKSKPKFFQCYLDNEVLLSHMSDEQAGVLWKSLLSFANTDEKPQLRDPIVALAFDVMAQQIERDFEKYSEKCEKNRANVNKRKRPLTTVNDGYQEEDKNKYEEEYKDKDEYEEEYKDKDEYKDEEEYKNKEDNISFVECDSTVQPEIKIIIDYLNGQTGSSYKASTKSTTQLIKARLTDGFTVDDFKSVIDGRVKAWGKDPKMREYLRPETLFSQKFESYLNSATQVPLRSYSAIYSPNYGYGYDNSHRSSSYNIDDFDKGAIGYD